MSTIIPAYAEVESCSDFPRLKYSIENGRVLDCSVNLPAGIIIEIETNGDGQLTMKIPRDIGLDEVCGNGRLFILVDGTEVDIKVEDSIFSRTTTVPFEDGNTQIELLDTFAGATYPPEILTCDTKQSPKQQVMSGIIPDEISCRLDFVLLQKSSNDTVVCVTPSTAEELVTRNWGNQIYQYYSDEIFTESGTQIVNYRIKNALVENITVDSQTRTLVVEMNSSEDGKIIVTIPRTILDSRLGPDGYSGEDDSFFVLIDGSEVNFAEKTDYFVRELAIPFTSGAKQIEIIGSFPIAQSPPITNNTN